MALPIHQRPSSSTQNEVVKDAAPDQAEANPGLAIVGQVAGGLLHDFNNILTVITGTIDILAEAVEDRPELAAVARLIDEAATRGARLTSQLLSFARGRPPRPSTVELNELLTDVGRLLRPTLGTEIEVTTSVAAGVPSAFADPGQLMAALLYLAITARNAMDQGGRIDIQATSACAATSGDDVVDECCDVRIVVTATANGAASLSAAQMFPDIRMVQDFVTQSNGRLALEPSHGGAASVEIVLPRAERD
ncbi:histidine kinase dimerization/phospho-acceptor domain-containing protein [Bradyrhizobium sp. HKCCYLS20291]|uniref:histidine kinase dimerization/phospho-acceptor domain-containing protein n=1 Tax=Bradyrhizobium sp. HKCCYLS20291 TaxID=3420766 RepID=UPI003EB93B4E